LALGTTNINVAARAFQAEARCLRQAGRSEDAIRVVEEKLCGRRFEQAADLQGRLIVANAELMELELITDRAGPLFQSAAQRLAERLQNYDNPALAAPQRRFLMKELARLSPNLASPTLAAEQWAAQFQENQHAAITRDGALQRSPLDLMWQFSTPDRRVLALIRDDKLVKSLRAVASPEGLPPDVAFTLLRPGIEMDSAFVGLPAGRWWPGCRLALSFKDPNSFVATSEHRTAAYLWLGLLAVAAMLVLTLLAMRVLRHQTALARLKTNLATTVSHELKTPLASMRVLVDTLLDFDHLAESRTREYLQLIAEENERLSQIIQSFLDFSRMERKKRAFKLAVA